MVTMKIVVDNECMASTKLALLGTPEECMDPWPFKRMAEELFLNVDDRRFIAKRDANKIVNDYAVTKLPFVLLVDDSLPEDKQEFAAVYSEEGPITIDRINAKL
jgi:hypothetical protein